jgi:hypothetical protein
MTSLCGIAVGDSHHSVSGILTVTRKLSGTGKLRPAKGCGRQREAAGGSEAGRTALPPREPHFRDPGFREVLRPARRVRSARQGPRAGDTARAGANPLRPGQTPDYK